MIKQMAMLIPQIKRLVSARDQLSAEKDQLLAEQARLIADKKKLFEEKIDLMAEDEGTKAEMEKLLVNQQLNALDFYSAEYPSPENALSIFKGEWISSLPEYGMGQAGLFDDPRIKWFSSQIGGFNDKKILELGPLEGGHTWMMCQDNPSKITAIEANARYFLKCLLLKDLYGLPVKFLYGDFNEFFNRYDGDPFDFILSSGVLYHMKEPHKLIESLCQFSKAIGVWTHFFDRDRIPETFSQFTFEPVSFKYNGVNINLYEHRYGQSTTNSTFCGGPAPISRWMSYDSIISLFESFGFEVIINNVEDHINGPCMTFIAMKK